MTSNTNTNRGQSNVVGAILIFGLLLTLLMVVQISFVPDVNEDVEFEHSHVVQQDIQEFGSSVGHVTNTGRPESVVVDAGLVYPSRIFLLNPPPVSGNLRINASENPIGITNARAVKGETAEFWNGTTREYETATFRYRADYNYATPPLTVFEHGILYNEFEQGSDIEQIVLDDGNLVQGRQLRLEALQGNLSQSTPSTVSLNVAPLSAPMQTVSVGADDKTDPIQFTFPTRLTEEEWRSILEGELCEDADGNGRCDDREDGDPATDPPGHVTDVDVSENILTITLEKGVTYDLQMGKAGVGDSLTSEKPYYVTDVRGKNASVQFGESQEFVVQVRDRYNNPVSGVTVTYADSGSDDGEFRNEKADGTMQVRTDENGYASAVFTPTRNGSIALKANAGDLGDENTVPNEVHETVVFDNVLVGPGPGDDESGWEINPNLPPEDGGSLTLVDVTPTETQGNKILAYNVTFENNGPVPRTLEELRYSFGFSSRSSGAEAPEEVNVSGPLMEQTTMDLGGPYQQVTSEAVDTGETLTLAVEPAVPTKTFDSFIVFSALVGAGNETESGLYFIDESISSEPLTVEGNVDSPNLASQVRRWDWRY